MVIGHLCFYHALFHGDLTYRSPRIPFFALENKWVKCTSLVTDSLKNLTV